MVSVLEPSRHIGFNIDSLLANNEYSCNIQDVHSSAEAVSLGYDKKTMDRTLGNRDAFLTGANTGPLTHSPSQPHAHKDVDFCSSCFDSSNLNSHDHLLSSVRPYETSTQNIGGRNYFRGSGLGAHSWSLLDSMGHVSSVPQGDIRHSSLGNLGFKLHNSFVQLDNISNFSNIQNISGGYPSFPGLYSQGGLSSPVLPSHHDSGVTGAALSWPSSRGGGYLSSVRADSGLFMSPYNRKPKRVRTAFSPTQLLRLEHAFEKNHYVVGQERKDLASCLNLSETQVKVWFQNRRTKHKRMKGEEEMTSTLTHRLRNDGYNEHSPNIDDVIIDP